MPRDKAPDTKVVADAASSSYQQVEEGLRGIVSAAEEADAASTKLTDTQKEALKITRSFSQAADIYAKKLAKATRVTSNFSAMSRVIAGSSAVMGDLASNTTAASVSLGKATSKGASFSSVLRSIDKSGDQAVAKIKSLSREVAGIASKKISLKVDIASLPTALVTKGVEVPLKWKTPLPPLPKLPVTTVDVQYNRASAAKPTSPASAKPTPPGAAKPTSPTSPTSPTFAGEIDRVASVTDLVKKRMLEGRREAEEFASGLGKFGGKATAAGVATVFLLGKVTELIDKYMDAAKALAEFNVAARVTAATTVGVDYSQLEDLREEVNLTKDQSADFYKVIKQGAESGVVSVAGLSEAAINLRNAFGGDPTDKLREFVDLVETIPTLEADISVTASADDRAASLFALAKQGKIPMLIEMQSAGLLGGVDMSMTNAEDVKLLNEQQKAVKVQEDIKDFLVGKLMPSIGPKIALIGKLTANTFRGIGGLIGLVGATNLLLGSQVSAQMGTTAAVWGAAGMGKAAKATQYAAGKTGAYSIVKDKFVGALSKGASAIKGFAAGITTATIAATVLVAGLAAISFGAGKYAKYQKKLSREYRIAGSDLRAANADVKSEYGVAGKNLAGFAAASAAAGMAIGVFATGWTGPGALLGAALGATVGAAVGLAKWMAYDKDSLDEAIRARDEATVSYGLQSKATREFRESMVRATRPSEVLSKALETNKKQFTDSALSFQRHITAIGKVVGSAKVEFSDLQKEVAGISLRHLTEFGGTIESFNSAIRESVEATTSQFDILNKGLSERRREIARDGKMMAEERRIALTELKKAELDATEKFVNGISEVIQQLLKTPGIAQAEMTRQASEQRVGYAADTGALSGEDLRAEISRGMAAQISAIEQIVAQLPETEKKQAERQNNLDKKAEEARSAARSLFSGISDDAKNIFKIAGVDLNRLSTGDFEKIKETASAQLKQINEEVARASEGMAVLEGGSVRGLREHAVGLNDALAKTKTALGTAETTLSETPPSHAKYKERQEKVAELSKQEADIEKSIVDNEERMGVWARKQADIAAKTLKSKASQADMEKAANIVALELAGKGDEAESLRKSAKAAELAKAIMERVPAAQEAALRAVESQAGLAQRAADAYAALGASEGVAAAAQSVRTKKIEDQLNIEKTLLDASRATVALLDKRKAENAKEVRIANRNLGIIEARAEIDREMGRGLENIEAQNEINRKTAADVLRNTVGMIAESKAEIRRLEGLRETSSPIVKEAIDGIIEGLRESIAGLERGASDAESRVVRVFSGMEDAIAAAMQGPSGRTAQFQMDLSGVQFELSEFSAAAEGAIGNTVEMAKKSARESARIQRQAIQRQFEQAKAAAAVLAVSKPNEAAERLKAAQVEMQYQLEKSKTEEVKAQLDAVKKGADIQKARISIQEEGLEDELDYLNYIGAHYSRMLDIQGDMVALAREKYNIEQKALEDMRATNDGSVEASRAILEQETKVRKAWFGMQKKGVGVQKDVMEKILGAAFGKLSSLGAATGIDRVSARRGVAESRVYNAAGMPMAAGPGGVHTIAERSIMRQLKGVGGRGGFGQAPRKLSAEAQMQKDMRGTADNTGTLAALTRKTSDAMLTAGSIYTHDKGTQEILGSILSVAEDIASKETSPRPKQYIDIAALVRPTSPPVNEQQETSPKLKQYIDTAALVRPYKENSELAGQAAAYKTLGTKDSARRLVQAARLAGEISSSFQTMGESIDNEASRRLDEIDAWKEKMSSTLAPHVQRFGAGNAEKTDSALLEMDDGITQEAQRRSNAVGQWREKMLEKRLKEESDYQRKRLGFYTEQDRQSRKSDNFRNGFTAYSEKKQSEYESKKKAFLAKGGISGLPRTGGSVRLEGRGPASRLSRTGGSVRLEGRGPTRGLGFAFEKREAKAVGDVTEHTTTHGADATAQGTAARQKMPGGAEHAFSSKPSFAYTAPTGEAGSSGGVNTMKIVGDLRIISNDPMLNGSFAEMVARVMNSAPVVTKLKQSGVVRAS